MYLNTHSYYSLRYGTFSIESLVEKAAAMNIPCLALTDINNTSGMIDFVKLCNEHHIRPVGGVEFRNDNEYMFTGIAKNNEGFRELNEFITFHNMHGKTYPLTAPGFEHVYVIYPFRKKAGGKLSGNEYIGVRVSDTRKLFTSDFLSDQTRLVAHQPVTFAGKQEYFLHRNLRAVDNNILISHLKPGQVAQPDEFLMPPEQMLKCYEDYPQIIRNTDHLLRQCEISFDYQAIKNKKTFTGSASDDRTLLEKLALDGFEYRYGKNNPVALGRVRKELDVIHQLGFAAYFLIAWDIIRYSLSRGFHHVGRGSGANSIVAYCLKITDVDPIELDLYFERFINPKRSNPPDFDIDYSWKEREEVQDYIFKRYGTYHTALLGTMSTFRGKSIIRELGKVYGLPKKEIDELVDKPETARNRSELTRKIFDISQKLLDFPNLRSIHAGGILISELPITYYTALDLPPKGFPTTQWDMYVAEDIRFEKFDILSQRGIGHIRDCAAIVRENRGISVDVHQVEKFKQDPQVKLQLRKGDTIGCFYIESPAMRGLLKKLRCDDYLTLVAASSIIRPGVARSGMMREYIQRFHHPGGFSYIHPIMEEQLKETFGVMVYQEDVLKICHHFGGLDLADADVLRRAMSGKFRGKKEMEKIVGKFFSNCKERGYPDEITKEVWRQIDSFAGYSFSKAHSASYAVESFQSLYLKAHYPLEFMTAVINNFGGFYQSWVYFSEARRQGASIHLPCVNNSNYLTRIKGNDLYTGFIHITNLEHHTGTQIQAEREQRGPFTGLIDFVERTQIAIEQLIILIRTGTLRFTGKTKAALLWEAHLYKNKGKPKGITETLFRAKPKEFTLPEFEQDKIESAYDEIEYLGFPITLSYFDLLVTSFRGEVFAGNLLAHAGKKVRMAGLLVTIKYVRTVNREWMHFGTFLDANGDFFDTVHFPPSLAKYPFTGNGVYLILGTVTEEFGFPSITVEKLARLPLMPDPRNA
jgi:DNA polymerase-3 subunit alpha